MILFIQNFRKYNLIYSAKEQQINGCPELQGGEELKAGLQRSMRGDGRVCLSHFGFYDRIPQPGWLKQQKFLPVVEVGSLRLWCTRQHLFAVSSHGGTRDHLLCLSLIRALIPFMRASLSYQIASHRPHPPIPSHWRVGFQHMNLGTNIQFLTDPLG